MLKVEIGGVDHADDISAMSVEFQLNERAVVRFECGPDYIPANRVPLTAYQKDGTTPLLGGVTLSRRVAGLAEQTLEDLTEVDAGDWSAFTDWAWITVSYAADVALETVLADLAAELAVYGITYTPVATGVTVAAFSWEDKRISDALRDLFTRIAGVRVFRFTATGALEAIVPGTVAAPFAITDAAPHCSALSWEDSPQLPANRVIVRCGPTGSALATQRWTADGIASSWVTDLDAADPAPALVLIDDGVTPYLATVGAGAMYEWDRATHTLSLGTDALPGAGTAIVLGPTLAAGDPFETNGYTAVYPFRVVRPAVPPAVPITVIVGRADLVEYGPAVEYAEGLLAQLDQAQPKELSIQTRDDGFEVGQLLTVNLTTARGSVVGDFLITAVSITLVRCSQDPLADPSDDYWEYVLTAIETTTYQGSYLDPWRTLTGGGGSGAVALSGGGGGSTTVLASPVFLGGTDRLMIPAAAAADWVDVYNVVPYEADASFTGRVRVEIWARDAGVGLKARLWNEDDDTDVQSSEVIAQARTFVTILSAILAGKTYRLQVKLTTGAGAVAANAGTLRAA